MSAISTIARESGVSVATVSRVLNNDRGVSDEIRKRTLEVIDRKGYKPRSNIKRGTRIGVVVQSQAPSFEAFFSRVLNGVSTYAARESIDTTLLFHQPPSQKGGMPLVELLRQKRCNGAILLSALGDEAEEVIKSRIPLVLVANRSEHTGIGFLDCDSYQGALELTSYLLRLGHQRIGFLCGSLNGNSDHQQRLNAYRDAMAAARCQYNEDWIVPHEPTEVTEQAGYDQAKKLLAKHPGITALVATNDLMAYGAIWACVESGRQVPKDISVVGYDDYSSSRFFNPPLTTVRQRLQEMGYDAAQAIDEKLRGIKETLPRKIFGTELIVRQSCAPPPHS